MKNRIISENGLFISVLFSAGKAFAMLFAIISFLAVVANSLLLAATLFGSNFEIPKFDPQEKSGLSLRNQSGDEDLELQGEKIKLNQQYGSELLNIIRENKITEVKTDMMIEIMLELPEEKRSQFVKGWKAYMEDGLNHARAKGGDMEEAGSILTGKYIRSFQQAMNEEEAGNEKRMIGRGVIVGGLVSSMFLLILSLMLPVLLKIERNTRNQGVVVEPRPIAAPAPSTSSACEKCGVAIAPNAAFCDECGHKVK